MVEIHSFNRIKNAKAIHTLNNFSPGLAGH